jgi:hypothetical protein
VKTKYIKAKSANLKSYEFKKTIALLGSVCNEISKLWNINIKCDGASQYKRGLLLIQKKVNIEYPNEQVSIKEIKKLVGRRRQFPIVTNHKIPLSSTKIFNSFILASQEANKICDPKSLKDSNIILEDNCINSFLYRINTTLTKIGENAKMYDSTLSYQCEQLRIEFDKIGQQKCCKS